MIDYASLVFDSLFDFLMVVFIFSLPVLIGKYVFRFFKNTSFFKTSRFFKPREYIPEEELSTIKQVLYLAMIFILVMDILYLIFRWRDSSFNLLLFDIAVSLYLAIKVETSSYKNMCILLFLVPFGSIVYLVDSSSYVWYLDLLHGIACVYFIQQYYRKFLEFTEDNSLGITILLLFSIVFISFFITIVVEHVSPINSIVMVSNAFTSNGYSILGASGLGKLNALFLVWAGFVLSGVGTSTLTVAIVMRHVNAKFDHLEELARKNKKE